MDIPADCRLNYIIGHEAWYWMPREGRRRYVRVGVDDIAPDGGCLWEFMIEEHVFTPRSSALRVGIFDDAWRAYSEIPEFFTALASERPVTFEAMTALLDRLGATDATVRQVPHPMT